MGHGDKGLCEEEVKQVRGRKEEAAGKGRVCITVSGGERACGLGSYGLKGNMRGGGGGGDPGW